MKYLRDTIFTLAIAIIFFILLQATIQTFRVNGTSMLDSILPGDCIVVNKISYIFKEPDRGEVVVLRSPQSSGTDLIKRIIALPGDSIEIRRGKVFVNNISLNESYIKEPPTYEFPLQKIPEGQYFVLGDNRNVSSDSHRGWYIPRDNIVGKAWICYWPIDRWGTIRHYNSVIDRQLAELFNSLLTAYLP